MLPSVVDIPNLAASKITSGLATVATSGSYADLSGKPSIPPVIPVSPLQLGASDTGISRIGAAQLAIGNGTANNTSGSLSLAYIHSATTGTVSGYFTGNDVGQWNNVQIDHSPATGNGNSGFGLLIGGVQKWATACYKPSGSNYSFTFYNVQTFNNSLYINGDTDSVGIGGSLLGFNLGTGTTADTGISRLAAGSLAIGNGTTGDTSGNISAQTHTITDFGSVPTSAGTAGTQGQIVQHNGVLYFCSVTGGAGSATWSTLTGGVSEMPSSIYHKVSLASTNAANIKAVAGTVTGWKVYNNSGAPVYVKLYDKATTPIPGTDTPKQTIGVDAGEQEVSVSAGFTYTTGIGIAIVKGILDSDNTPVAASDCVVDIFYQ
jgi:hypothetical protein